MCATYGCWKQASARWESSESLCWMMPIVELSCFHTPRGVPFSQREPHLTSRMGPYITSKMGPRDPILPVYRMGPGGGGGGGGGILP